MSEGSSVSAQSGSGTLAPPFLSIVVPVYRTPLRYLAELLQSVTAQNDPDWELILVDDGSADEDLTSMIVAAAARDARIRPETLPINSGIAVASNRGLELARGMFVALLDHDDILASHAVDACRRVVRFNPGVDVMYSDETIVGAEGEVLGEFRKPIFSPERLRSQMYTCHLPVYRRSLLQSIGGFRDGFAGSQDYDLVLRATERTTAVAAIPHSLYRWRILPTSVSHSEGKDVVFDGALRALADHLVRIDAPARATLISEGLFRVVRDVPTDANVSVILPSRAERAFVDGADQISLPRTLELLTGSCGDRLGSVTVVVGDDSAAVVARSAVDSIPGGCGRVRLVDGDPGTPFALNKTILGSTGTHVLLWQDGVTPAGDGWLDVLLGLAGDPTIGAVGPRVLRWDGTVAAAGVAVDGGSVRAIGAGTAVGDPGPFGALQLEREVTALPAECVLLSRTAFLQAGGLSLGMPTAVALIDLSLKMADLGYRTVVSPAAEVRVPAMTAAMPTADDLGPLRARWGGRLAADAYWRDF